MTETTAIMIRRRIPKLRERRVLIRLVLFPFSGDAIYYTMVRLIVSDDMEHLFTGTP